ARPHVRGRGRKAAGASAWPRALPHGRGRLRMAAGASAWPRALPAETLVPVGRLLAFFVGSERLL
ncbi:MAG: hypothetical protein LBR80_03485, partial [Deltaproteobacteria bacterium]|nr:hypothetical protein [Deltaproteobacteria bacterium]